MTVGALLTTGIIVTLGLGFLQDIDSGLAYMMVVILLLGAVVTNARLRDALTNAAQNFRR